LPNEPIVFVATSSRHRRDSFESADFLMDYLKSEAPFWKSEKSSGQVRWIEPRVQDFKDKKRWEE
jgi:molybdopterin synthase catalytic subunit